MVVTDDVPMGATPPRPRLSSSSVLVNDVSLRNLIPGELAKGFGFLQSKPRSALSPVAVTPDDARRRLAATASCICRCCTSINGKWFGEPTPASTCSSISAELIAHAAKTRSLGAGTIVGSGTVSNRDAGGGPGKPIGEGGRAIRASPSSARSRPSSGKAAPSRFSRPATGCASRCCDANGHSIFGAIEQ